MTTSTDTTGGSFLGNSVKRREDPALLRGQRHYSGDLTAPRMLHAAFVRSQEAHAEILEIDTSLVPDDVIVLTGHDIHNVVPAAHGVPAEFARRVLPTDRVRYVGDIVAMVLAPTERAARDAADLIWLETSSLPVIADVASATDDTAPILFPDAGTNVVDTAVAGNSDDALADAEVIIRQKFVQQRMAAVPLEPAGILATPLNDGRLLVQHGTQDPAGARRVIATALEREPESVRVLVPAVGGGFGAKGSVYAEHVAVAAAAVRLGRPVRWIERRTENLINMVHGRAQTQVVEMGATRDGRVTGLKAHYRLDAGAYPTISATFGKYTMMMSSGVYDIPKMQLSSDSVVTNRTPTGPYRGAGRPEATQMLERMMDLLAHELGMDRVEIRRKNLIAPFTSPRAVSAGINYDSGDYDAALARALERADWDRLIAERDARRAADDPKQLGVGLALYIETTVGVTPKMETGGITVEPDGTIVVRAGGSSHGQGHETTFAQIAADRFQVPMEQVRVVQSDTDAVGDGVAGTYASRTLQLVGSSVSVASDVVLGRARDLAAQLLEADPSDIVVAAGGMGVAGVPGSDIPWSQLAQAAEQRGEPLTADEKFGSADATYPFGAHVSVVEVDTETGWARLVRHISVDDCGNIVNPMLVMGQQHGGIAQGVGQALFEEALFDGDGNPLTANLVGYTVPTAVDLPMFEVDGTTTPTPLNPLGAKGVGEAGTLGSTPAIHSAVMDALAPLGVRHIDLPLTPSKIWTAIVGGVRSEE